MNGIFEFIKEQIEQIYAPMSIINTIKKDRSNLISRINECISLIASKYRYYNLYEDLKKLNETSEKILNYKIKRWFYTKNYFNFQSLLFNTDFIISQVQSDFETIDSVKTIEEKLFKDKHTFVRKSCRITNNDVRFNELKQKLKDDYTQQEYLLEDIQKTLQTERPIGSEQMSKIKNKIQNFKNKMYIISMKEKYVFEDYLFK